MEYAETQEYEGPADPEDETQELKPASGSLAGRMSARADELQKSTVGWFPIPGYEDMLECGLSALSWQKMHHIQSRNARKVRDPALESLYNLADQIIAATEGFREVDQDQRSELDGETWVSLAQRLPNPPDNCTPRQAVLFLVGDAALPFLVQEYSDWARARRQEDDEEVVRDFAQTG
jgi:hypothetical protein